MGGGSVFSVDLSPGQFGMGLGDWQLPTVVLGGQRPLSLGKRTWGLRYCVFHLWGGVPRTSWVRRAEMGGPEAPRTRVTTSKKEKAGGAQGQRIPRVP